MRTVEVGGVPVGPGHPTRVMSVLNLSENSGYDPSVHENARAAARAVDEELVPAGADIVDVGLQSANPAYERKPPAYERERLERAAEVLDLVESDVPFAVETRYASVAERAVEVGFDLVNDVCGFADPEMKPTCERLDVPVVKMASPPDLDRPGDVKTTDDVLEAIQRDGFTDRTIVDPAFGGWSDEKTHADNHAMLRRLSEFRAFGRPILTATNREDFLGALAGRSATEEQLPVSLAAATIEVVRGSDVIRTHDTRETRDVARVADALGPATGPPGTDDATPGTDVGAADTDDGTPGTDGGAAGTNGAGTGTDDTMAETDADDPLTIVEQPGATHGELAVTHDRAQVARGDPADGAVRSYSVAGLDPVHVETLVAEADAASVPVAVGDGRVHLSGTVAALDGLRTRLSASGGALGRVARSLPELSPL